MQVIENWADLQGRVKGVAINSALPNYALAELEVTEAKAVEGFPNLFSWAKGQTIFVNVPIDARLTVGDRVAWRVRKAGPTVCFLHPDVLPATTPSNGQAQGSRST